MNAEAPFRLTLDVSAESETVITAWAITHLRERGYSVASPNEKWETITAFRKRVGVHSETVRKALGDPLCPSVPVHRGKTRIIELLSNPVFDAFCRRNKK